MGCVYTGFKSSRSVNGFFKVGMTHDLKPTKRWNAYDLTGLLYIVCPEATTAELLYLESVARLAGERLGMKLQGNDCLLYQIQRGSSTAQKVYQASRIADQIMLEVIEECENKKINYTLYSYIAYSKNRG